MFYHRTMDHHISLRHTWVLSLKRDSGTSFGDRRRANEDCYDHLDDE